MPKFLARAVPLALFAAPALAHAEAAYPGWMERLLTHPVRGLENWSELFEKLTSPKGAIKVFCEVAAL